MALIVGRQRGSCVRTANTRANDLARVLAVRGAGLGTVVGVTLPYPGFPVGRAVAKSTDLVTSLVGASRAAWTAPGKSTPSSVTVRAFTARSSRRPCPVSPSAWQAVTSSPRSSVECSDLAKSLAPTGLRCLRHGRRDKYRRPGPLQDHTTLQQPCPRRPEPDARTYFIRTVGRDEVIHRVPSALFEVFRAQEPGESAGVTAAGRSSRTTGSASTCTSTLSPVRPFRSLWCCMPSAQLAVMQLYEAPACSFRPPLDARVKRCLLRQLIYGYAFL